MIKIEISSRHVHASRKDIDSLFGKGYKLKILKKLSQPGEFAAKETVTLINKDKKIEHVRVLGPERRVTQVELAKTDAIHLGVNAPLRESGNLSGSAGIMIKGPKGKIKLSKGVIIAKRHLHASEIDAKKLGIKNGQLVGVKISGKREAILNKIVVRVSSKYKLAVHLDTDESNAAGVEKETYGEILK